MKLKRSINNILFGFLNLLITALLGMIIPRLLLVNFGSEINGLISSINQIFAYFIILEAGVGLSTLQSLYGPVGNNNISRINGILSATNKYYKKSGVIYFFALLLFAFLYPTIISSSVEESTIISVIMLTGMSGVINFLFQGKYQILLQAEGKNYIIIMQKVT